MLLVLGDAGKFHPLSHLPGYKETMEQRVGGGGGGGGGGESYLFLQFSRSTEAVPAFSLSSVSLRRNTPTNAGVKTI